MDDQFDALALDELRRLRVLVQSNGERSACRALGIPRATLARLLAGLRVRRGTVALVRAGLSAPEATGAA
jgi:hypothetical protein